MRNITLFNDNWKFQLEGKEPETVQIPHTWNAVDGQDGGDDYFRGKGVYEKIFAKPELAEGQRLTWSPRRELLQAEVKLNGKTVATHDGRIFHLPGGSDRRAGGRRMC